MEEQKREVKTSFWKSGSGKVVIFAVLVVIGFFIRTNLEDVYDRQVEERKEASKYEEQTGPVGRMEEMLYAEPVDKDNELLQKYLKEYPDANVMIACEEDLTDDGIKDLLVIHRERDDFSYATIVIGGSDGESYTLTEPILAPYENHKIQFKNIDKEAEIEFVLMGERDGVTGYGIFRMVEGQPVNLFGEGMEDC